MSFKKKFNAKSPFKVFLAGLAGGKILSDHLKKRNKEKYNIRSREEMKEEGLKDALSNVYSSNGSASTRKMNKTNTNLFENNKDDHSHS